MAQPSLTGRWRKDKARSESMDAALDMVKLPWLYRKALALLTVMELLDNAEVFVTTLKAGGIMDIVERYPWTGDPVDQPRRDKRRGHHTAYVTRTEEGHPSIVSTWEDPYGGDSTDVFELSPCGNVMAHHTEMSSRATGERTRYKIVYNRIH